MRRVRFFTYVVAVLASGWLHAQTDIGIKPGPKLSPWDLENSATSVPGMGTVPGAELVQQSKARFHSGDDPAYASRDFVDSTWQKLSEELDTIAAPDGVHWLRFRLLPDSTLRGKKVILGLGNEIGAQVFLNGDALFSTTPGGIDAPLKGGAVVPILVPFSFRCDGRTECIAIRLDPSDAKSARVFARKTTLHAGDMAYANQRSMAQYGVFIGINLVILILALVIWSFERREKHWLYLAGLSFFSALDTYCDLGSNVGMGGSTPMVSNILGAIKFAIAPWPLFLLVLTLGTLHGQISARRWKWYRIAILSASVPCIAFAIGILIAKISGGSNSYGMRFELHDPDPVLIGVVIFLALLLATAMGWFVIEVIRLGFKLIRTKGYARWIGAGALASSLFAYLLNMLAGVENFEGTFTSFLSVVGDYCSHAAVPLSVAIYLAIRSAHHNKLVARQRDELDLEVKERTAELTVEKERSDELLLNILPAEVAEELKATGAAKARHFDQASVLFTDFMGFTGMAAQMGAEVLLNELNTCFEAFDTIITRHGVEKIKTIGDAYMCVGGLPDPHTSSPNGVVHAALEMQAFMAVRKREHDALGKPAFEMRVGIHTGPVVAGIVGVKKFQYDIWGDAVNTASRMESSGAVGRVNISESTYALVKDEPGLIFTARGKVQAKGKGEMEMYFVETRLPSHALVQER
ncbi:MAG: adenylate/guanylate cyclase domain-containing protein [Flavobacteriales bacterium]